MSDDDILSIRWKPVRRYGMTIDDYVAEGMKVAEAAFAAQDEKNKAIAAKALEPKTIEHEPNEDMHVR